MVAQTQKLIIMKKIRRITIDYFCCSINDIDALERVNTNDINDVQITIVSQSSLHQFWVSQDFAKGLIEGMNDLDKKYSIILYEY